MKLVARSARSLVEQRRRAEQRRRVAAGTLGEAFPTLEQLRIELTYQQPSGSVPVRQVHEMYQGADALLEFPCPHGDCDGAFELAPAIHAMVKRGKSAASGRESCRGQRAAKAGARQPCTLGLHYRLLPAYLSPPAPAP